MPACYKCNEVAASSEMRRTTKILLTYEQAWICRDTSGCRTRVRALRRAALEQRRRAK